MSKYTIGDRICAAIDNPAENNELRAGDTGTVVIVDEGSRLPFGIKWDVYCSGHNLDGLCEYGYGWWVSGSEIIAIEDIEHIFNEDYDMPSVSDEELASLFV